MKLHPIVHHIILGFGLFNIIMGCALFLIFPIRPLEVISLSIPQRLWSFIFIASGTLLLYALNRYNLKLIRLLMIFGLFVKTCWAIGLVLRASVDAPNTIYASLFWAFIFYVQFLGVVYFAPKEHL